MKSCLRFCAALVAALALAAPAMAQQHADGATPTRAGANHALAGKTCHGSFQAKNGSSCASCYGSFRVVFDRAGGAVHGAAWGWKAHGNPTGQSYVLEPVSDLRVEGGAIKYTTKRGVYWTLEPNKGSGETEPGRSSLKQGANVTGLVCS